MRLHDADGHGNGRGHGPFASLPFGSRLPSIPLGDARAPAAEPTFSRDGQNGDMLLLLANDERPSCAPGDKKREVPRPLPPPAPPRLPCLFECPRGAEVGTIGGTLDTSFESNDSSCTAWTWMENDCFVCARKEENRGIEAKYTPQI